MKIADIVIGVPVQAARGLRDFLCCETVEYFNRLAQGIDGIYQECVAIGDPELLENYDYVLNQRSSEKPYPNGIRDRGRSGAVLDDFLRHPFSKQAKLTRAEVFALRLYTTSSYKHFNEPLRDLTRQKTGVPHPMGTAVSLLMDGLKKLRDVRQQDPSKAGRGVEILWRGLMNVQEKDSWTDSFLEKGGTELGAMSTTVNITIAASASISDECLLFKIKVDGFFSCGADLSFLSAFPDEKEVLFPPLTFLKPSGYTEVLELVYEGEGSKTKKVTVIEVIPQIS